MNTGIEASDIIFTILNVTAVTNLLDGRVYKEEPLNELLYQKRNITIVPLSTSMNYMNEHIINVNIFVPDLKSGQTHESTLKNIAEIVITTLRAYAATTNYFHSDVISNQVVKDENRRSYVNIRIEVTTE